MITAPSFSAKAVNSLCYPIAFLFLSNAGVNNAEAYGELLRFCRDQDGDGWPDIMDNCPTTEGFKDGCSNYGG